MSNLFSVQAHNNAWANYRLSQACNTLSAKELATDRNGFFGSIIATLNHILIVDWFYVSAMEGACIGQVAFENLIPFSDMEKLTEAQRAIDARFISVCSDDAPDLARKEVRMIRSDRVQIERFDRTFLHLIQHQIHHRGQVHGLLSQTDAAPPQLDEFYLAWDPDKSLRKRDLKALGTTEKEVWGD